MPDTQPVIRQPAVAGQFDPAEPSRLRHDVAQLLETSGSRAANAPVKALIVPHAGYVDSGAVAAQAYARLAAQAATIHRVVLLGPVHRVAVRGLALPDADLFATPLGQVPIDREAVAALAGLRQVVRSSAALAEPSARQRDRRSAAMVPMLLARARAARVFRWPTRRASA